MKDSTIILFRPTGPKELELVKKNGYKKWPYSYRGFLELYEYNNWKPAIMESLVFWNPIGIRSVFYYQNNIIL
jgi:hypothetical protein